MLSDRRKAGGVVESVKRAGSAVAGAAAGVIDLIRTEGLPKNLRDDYTAFSLANIGYVMLYTTALAVEDQEVADLAHQQLRDYTDAVMRLNSLIPAAVVRFLEQQGLPVRADIVSEVTRTWPRLGSRHRTRRPRNPSPRGGCNIQTRRYRLSATKGACPGHAPFVSR